MINYSQCLHGQQQCNKIIIKFYWCTLQQANFTVTQTHLNKSKWQFGWSLVVDIFGNDIENASLLGEVRFTRDVGLKFYTGCLPVACHVVHNVLIHR